MEGIGVLVEPTSRHHAEQRSGLELMVTALSSAAGLALLAGLASLGWRPVPLTDRGAEMLIKLIGLLFAGVFVGATIYEVSRRGRRHGDRRAGGAASGASADQEGPPQP
jgi:hypothetical protein